MSPFVAFFFIIGIFLVIQGVYDQKIKNLEKNKRIEYRFIPRTYLEEQLADSNVSGKMSHMFNTESPWFERTVTLPKPDK